MRKHLIAPITLLSAKDAFALPLDALYLDCAAHGPPLHTAIAAGHAALDARPWPGRYDDWQADIERLRMLAGNVLFDGDTEGVAFIPSAAYGLATAARNLSLTHGDAVLVLEGQFPSDLLAWQQRCAETGSALVVVYRDVQQTWADAIIDALERMPHVRVASLCQAHWHDGSWIDLDRIAPELHKRDIALVLDLSQSLGALPTNLAHWQPDFVVSVGYKWLLGATGLAWLWAAPRWRQEGVALEQHWIARDPYHVWLFDPDAMPAYRTGARRFDAGGVTDPVRLARAEVALLQLQAWGIPRIAEQLGVLTTALDYALDAQQLSAWNTLHHAPHFTALRPPQAYRDAIADAFNSAEIVCTRRDDGCIRVAPHLHVDPNAMQRIVDIIAKTIRVS